MIPINLLKNRQLKKETQELARELQTRVEQATLTDRATGNPQLALKSFKTEVVKLYQRHQKTHRP